MTDQTETAGEWRVGKHYGIHVYQGDRPVGTFHRQEDAAAAVGLGATVADSVRILREAGVHHGEGLAARVRNLIAELDRARFLNGEAEHQIERALAELRERTAERDQLKQTLEIVRAQADDCVTEVDAVLGHRYHTPGIHYSIPHVTEKAAAELNQLQARIDKALALLDAHDQPDGVGRLIDEVTTALQGDAPTEPAPDLDRATDMPSPLGTSPPASPSAVDSGEAVAKSVAYCGYATDEPPAPFVPAADAFPEVTDG